MSVISVNHLCRDVTRDPDLRSAFLADPEAALDAYPRRLAPAERAALLAGDVGTLRRLGVDAYLMGYLGHFGLFGLTERLYAERIRAGA